MGHEEEYEDDWMAEAPTLASLDKHVEFDVPEGYFDELPTQVMARIQAMSKGEVQPMPAPTLPVSPRTVWGMRTAVIWSAAASIALLIVMGTVYFSRSTETTPTQLASADAELKAQLAELEPAALIEGLDEATVNDEELYAMLGDDASKAFDSHDHQVHEDEAYEYLQDVNLDAIDLQGLDIDLNDL